MKKIVIAISGPPGVGSTTLGEEIAKELNLKFFSLGTLIKSQIKAKNQTEAVLKLWKTKKGRSKSFHQKMDRFQVKLARDGNVVIVSKLAIFMLKDMADLKIWLKAPLSLRAKRVSERDGLSFEESKKSLEKREKLERSFFRDLYGVDYFEQEKLADIVFENKYKLKKSKKMLLERVTKRIEWMKEFSKLYKMLKKEIRRKLQEFQSRKDEKKIFEELAFCICVPQSRADVCEKTISNLSSSGKLYKCSYKELVKNLKGVRFRKNKARFIIEARRKFFGKLSSLIKNFANSYELREWLTKNVRGMGMKEASHFIRNIGFDYRHPLSILDRHVLKTLKEICVIEKIPKHLTKRKYLEIEKKFLGLAKSMRLHPYELDLVIWYKKTGKILR